MINDDDNRWWGWLKMTMIETMIDDENDDKRNDDIDDYKVYDWQWWEHDVDWW